MSLRWANRSFCWFCRAAAQMYLMNPVYCSDLYNYSGSNITVERRYLLPASYQQTFMSGDIRLALNMRSTANRLAQNIKDFSLDATVSIGPIPSVTYNYN